MIKITKEELNKKRYKQMHQLLENFETDAMMDEGRYGSDYHKSSIDAIFKYLREEKEEDDMIKLQSLFADIIEKDAKIKQALLRNEKLLFIHSVMNYIDTNEVKNKNKIIDALDDMISFGSDTYDQVRKLLADEYDINLNQTDNWR